MGQGTNPTDTSASTGRSVQYHDTRVDVKLVLSALWIAMLFVSAYVDIFAFFRKDVLRAGLDGKFAGTALSVDQVFLSAGLIYILLPSLMVVLSLILKPHANRITNIAVSLFYAVTIVVSCVGETWVYYLLGSAVEIVPLLAIARTAWKWPRQHVAA
ncbi:MAG: hypothetical protein DLM58_12835 [Pseudonocardiales bacterium]|nr:MAG: hypothetical protein DLM58_12835 [Pseudonocardiales bacterium]